MLVAIAVFLFVRAALDFVGGATQQPDAASALFSFALASAGVAGGVLLLSGVVA